MWIISPKRGILRKNFVVNLYVNTNTPEQVITKHVRFIKNRNENVRESNDKYELFLSKQLKSYKFYKNKVTTKY